MPLTETGGIPGQKSCVQPCYKSVPGTLDLETGPHVPCEANGPTNASRGGLRWTPAGLAEGLRPEEGESDGDLGYSH